MGDEQSRVRHLLEKLDSAGKRRTAQRDAICRALVGYGGHPTVAEIYERVRAHFPMISQATVYNTLDTLRDLGLITRLDIAHHDHTHFDLDTTAHVNVVCLACGEIADVLAESMEALVADVARASGYRVSPEAGLIMYGICPACSRAPRSEPA